MATTIPTPTPISALAGKVAAAARGNGATPPVAITAPVAPPQETKTVPATEEVAKKQPKHKLIQIMLEDKPEFQKAMIAAANAAQLSLSNWATQVLARELKVELPTPEKKARTEAEKAELKADNDLLKLVLTSRFYTKLGNTSGAAKETAKITAYVKKLAGTIGQEKANAVLAATNAKADTAGM